MLKSKGALKKSNSLLGDYVDRYADAVARRRSNVALRAARVESELAYKSRGEFLANMNHELRTPLNAISGFAEMLKQADEYALTSEQKSEYCDFIIQSSDLLLSQINKILDMAAAESGGAKMHRMSVNSSELFQAIISDYQPKAHESGVSLTIKISGELENIDVDPDKIRTAVSHLLDNALTYVHRGGRVSLALRNGGEVGGRSWVYAALKDDGDGMSENELSRAMRAFEQVHQGLDRKFDGAGIGLPIAKSFVELNGGKFDIQSEKGAGTIIRLALPTAAPVEGSDVISPGNQLRRAG